MGRTEERPEDRDQQVDGAVLLGTFALAVLLTALLQEDGYTVNYPLPEAIEARMAGEGRRPSTAEASTVDRQRRTANTRRATDARPTTADG